MAAGRERYGSLAEPVAAGEVETTGGVFQVREDGPTRGLVRGCIGRREGSSGN
jgi:hypothetical protein